MSTRRPHRALPAAMVLGLLGAGTLTGCAASGEAGPVPRPSTTAPIPTASVTPPAGVSLTSPGTRLPFGRAASVGFAQNADRQTVLSLTVLGVRRGRAADLAAYSLDAQARASTPYYATVRVTNLGPGDVSRASVPLWAVASDGTLVASTGFTTPLPRCASASLPALFSTGASTRTCQVFLLPAGTSLTRLSYQPATSDQPVTWQGTIAGPSGRPRASASPAR